MAPFSFWPANQFHPVWQNLSLSTRGVFLELAGHIADGERIDLPDGMFLAIWLVQVQVQKEDLLKAIEELEQAGIFVKIDEPEGWLVKNWTARATVVRPTSLEAQEIYWGQGSALKHHNKRVSDNERKRKSSKNSMS
jgi:hypothetical protein